MPAAPDGWVVPECRSLSRRPLTLGLPFGVAWFLLVLACGVAALFHVIVATIVGVSLAWFLGSVVTRRDPWSWEKYAKSLQIAEHLHRG